MKLRAALAWLLVSVVVLSGCASTSSGVIAYGPDTFTVVQAGKSGFTSTADLKTAAYKEANEYAASKGKQIEIIDVSEKPAGFGKMPQVEVKFRLLDKK